MEVGVEGNGQVPVVEVRDLVKQYRKAKVNAVDGVSFAVRRGEVFGLLGPNGAGKTTTVGVLTTRVRRTGGMASVSGVDVGVDPVRARSLVAVVPQRNNLDRSLSIRQNLLFHAAYHGVPAAERARRADALLEEFGLAERANDKPDMFSGGQAQRVMVARALMHAPEVLFLDEPTTGLDPRGRNEVWEAVRGLVAGGTTVLLTTQYLDEADQLADRISVIDHGRVIAEGSPEQLKSRLGGDRIDVVVRGPGGDTPRTQGPLDVRLVIDSPEARVSSIHLGVSEGPATPIFLLGHETVLPAGETELRCSIPHLPLPRGRFYLWLGIFESSGELLPWHPVSQFSVLGPELGASPRGIVRQAPIELAPTWEVERRS